MGDLSEQVERIKTRWANATVPRYTLEMAGNDIGILLAALAQREAERDTLEKVNQGYRDWIERCAETLGGLSPQEYAEQAEAALANSEREAKNWLNETKIMAQDNQSLRAMSERLREALDDVKNEAAKYAFSDGGVHADILASIAGIVEFALAAQPDAGQHER